MIQTHAPQKKRLTGITNQPFSRRITYIVKACPKIYDLLEFFGELVLHYVEIQN